MSEHICNECEEGIITPREARSIALAFHRGYSEAGKVMLDAFNKCKKDATMTSEDFKELYK